MYFAGIYTTDTRTEALVCTTLFVGMLASLRKLLAAFQRADATGGRLISLPATWTGKLVTPTHALATFVPVIIYLATVPRSGFSQPEWIRRLALPDFGLDGDTVTALRLVGCVSAVLAWAHAEYCVRKLGQSWHIIGVREKPKIVDSGPYAIVRHPFYSSVLVLEIALAVMSWNVVPLYALGICAGAFAVKIPIEERLIESDKNIGPEYREYKKRVTSRFLPGIF